MKILITSIVDLMRSQHNRPHQFVKYLSKNHEITVLSIKDWWKEKQTENGYNKDFEDIFNKINIVYLTEKKVSPILQEVLSRKSTKLKEDFDVHLNYSTLISGYLAAKKIKTVYDIADDLGAMIRASPQIPRLLRPFGGALGDFMIKKNIEKSEKVTVTTASLVGSYNIPKNKSEVIPNGVDTKLFRNYRGAKSELGLNGFIIGYVGVLREWVNLEPVFSALKQLNGIKMLVVGREGKFTENVNLARKYGVEDKVIFTGGVPYSHVPKYISAMDVCLIPFKLNEISKNALPLKLFEYMACEKPIISTELPGIRNIAENKVKYASNEKEYAERIMELSEDRDLRIEMGRNGRRFVEQNYDWERITKKMEKILITISEAA